MNTILLGNGITLLGAVIMVLCGLITDKKKYLIAQSAQFMLMGLGNAVLGGMTGMISNLSGMLRNIWTCYFHINVWAKLAFIALQAALSLSAGPVTLISLLPLLSGAAFTWFIDMKDPMKFKWLIIICQSTWIIYDLSLMNYVSVAFDVFTITSNAIAIVRMHKNRNLHSNP